MITTKIQIRFADIDVGGHVHNAAYLHYFESARVAFFVQGLGTSWDWKTFGFIVKRNTVEYHSPVLLTDQIRVEVNSIHIGGKSFTLSYHILDAENKLKAYGESVIVCFDYYQQSTIAIPLPVLEILRSHYTGTTPAQ